MTAADAIRQMRRVGLTLDVVGNVVILEGGNRRVREVWRPIVKKMRRELVALLAPAVHQPAQLGLAGVRR